jgi:hypothetical protein
MAIESRWCPVLQGHVTCLTDLEGTVVRVICYQFDKATHTCRLKKSAQGCGPLARLLVRHDENALADVNDTCPMV